MRGIKILLVICCILILGSCNKFKGNQEIPAYLHVDGFSLRTNYADEGAATHKITDVWLYVDDSYQGCYELPATIPVLEHGKHKVTLYPGIKMNGIASTRIIYPFYKPYIIDSYDFGDLDKLVGLVDTISPSTRYYTSDESTIKFWFEDFEQPSIKFEKTHASDTAMIKTERNDENAWLSDDSQYSGHIWIGDTLNYVCVSTPELPAFPGQGNYVLVEMDYKCETEFLVGLYASITGSINDIELVYVNPSEDWNKIYINLGPSISDNANNALYFKLYIRASVEEGQEANLYFDNIKIVYRD